MCGICGQLNLDKEKTVSSEAVRRMSSAISHRGPDDSGLFVSGPVGLGFRRLSIIDLSGGHQPMSDAQETVWVVFNGEIYNFRELRRILEASGHVFRTNSDTEVIVHGYKQWGAGVLERLNGMFGLAIWDVKAGQLMLARDRMGIKPLYYKKTKDAIVFASEVRSLLALDGEKPEPDMNGVYLFLRYRYVPSPFTAFKGISKLAPGTRLIVNGPNVKTERWWNSEPKTLPAIKEKDAEAELLELYRESVKRHLVSDVPVGLLLSGGLDSGLLLALMSAHGDSWRTYTVGFQKGFENDEIEAAGKVAGAFGARHESVMLDRERFEKMLPELVKTLEEPVTAASIAPMYHVCARARQDVKVALMGQGPDELFGGYKRHLGLYYGKYWRALPSWMKVLGSAGLSFLPGEAVRRGAYALDTGHRFRRYEQVFSIIPDGFAESLFKPGALPSGAESRVGECWQDLYRLISHADELGGLQALELRSALPDELLLYADKLSMAHGLEIRVPYLDNEIVKFAEKLPASLKIRWFKGKWLHRRVCEKFLPAESLKMRKLGFETPVDSWLTKPGGSMRDNLLDENSLIYSYIRPETVKGLLLEHANKKNDNTKILFSLSVLEEWMRAFIKK